VSLTPFGRRARNLFTILSLAVGCFSCRLEVSPNSTHSDQLITGMALLDRAGVIDLDFAIKPAAVGESPSDRLVTRS
jgi:hypothetical protein